MEIEITIRVRAIVPDGLHLPRLSVDKNLDIPLRYLEGMPPTMHTVGIDPKVLTVQHAILPSPQNQFRPFEEAFTALGTGPTSDRDPESGPPDPVGVIAE